MTKGTETRLRPSPVGASSLDELAATLGALREWAGSPSYAEIARRIRRQRAQRNLPPAEQAPGRVTVYDCFRRGRSRLDLDLVCDIVAALGADAQIPEWRQAYAAIEGQVSAASVVRVETPIPGPRPEFAGRADQLALLSDPAGPPVWLIAGMPGVGKTELALLAAASLRPQGWDQEFLVHLRGYDEQLPPADPHAVLGTLLRGLDVPPAETQRLDLAGRVARVRRAIAGLRVLVVVDNARHTDQVAPLLEALAGARVLVTSRQTLSEELGAQLELDVLTTAEALALLAKAAPGTQVSDDADTRRIVELCGHLPLHLSLTAARIAETPDWAMADQVHRLESLPPEDAVLPALASSYHALDPADRAVFRLLALHPGDVIAPDSVAALGEVTSVAATSSLARLGAEHLVRLDADGRARMHDLVRAYAGRLSREEDPRTARAAALRRLLVAYRDGVRRAVADLERTGPDGAATAQAARDWLRAEASNITTAALASTDDGVGDLVSVAEALMPWLESDARFAEAEALGRAATNSADPAHQAVGARLLSRLCDLTGQFDDALAWAHQAVAAGGDHPAAIAVNQVGNVLMRMGRIEEAGVVYADAVALARAAGERRDEARYLGNLATIEQTVGATDEALQHFTEALELSESVADLQNVGTVCANLSDLHLRREDYDAASRAVERAYEIDEALGARLHLPRHLNTMGDIASRRGDHEGALALLSRSFDLARETRAELYEAEAWIALGEAHLRVDDPAPAAEALSAALALGQRLGSPWIEAGAQVALGVAHLALGELDQARDALAAGRAIAASMNSAVDVARADEGLGDCAAASGDTAAAVAHWQAALAFVEGANDAGAVRLRARIAALT